MSMDQKYEPKLRVFVSSVQKELGPERAAVSQVIAVDPFLEKHCEAVLFETEPTTGIPKKKADLSRADGFFIVTLPGPNGDYDRIRVTGKVAGPVTPAIEKQLTERQRKMVSLLMNGEELVTRDCEVLFGVTRPSSPRTSGNCWSPVWQNESVKAAQPDIVPRQGSNR